MGADLSVVLAASGGYPAVQLTVSHLRQQSIASSIELILVGFEGPLDVPPQVRDSFHSVQTIALPHQVSIAEANARGVRIATAPVVAFSEDHAFPQPGWAEALVSAHRSPHAVVGPAVVNANPASMVSWCDFLVGYGPWMEPTAAGPRPFLPGHNSSYKRDVLLALGDRLPEMLESETVLHFQLAAGGHSLWLEPRARLAHVNFSLLSVWFPVQFHCGRVFGGFRAANWPLPRKLLYAAASPLIPWVRLARCLPLILRQPSLLGILPLLACGLAVDGIGQFVGYLAGPGESPALLSGYEYNRIRFVTQTDREALAWNEL